MGEAGDASFGYCVSFVCASSEQANERKPDSSTKLNYDDDGGASTRATHSAARKGLHNVARRTKNNIVYRQNTNRLKLGVGGLAG